MSLIQLQQALLSACSIKWLMPLNVRKLLKNTTVLIIPTSLIENDLGWGDEIVDRKMKISLTHTHTHARAHAHTHTRMHIHTCTHLHTHARTHTHTESRICTAAVVSK